MLNLQEDLSWPGIWRFHQFLHPVKEASRLSLNEGNTPGIEKDGLVFKREDSNPTGSLKDRGLAYQISKAHEENEKNLVISSSGNAAISAAAYCNLAKIELFAFVSQKIAQEKKEKIIKYNGRVKVSLRPVSDSIKFCKRWGYKNLRPSTEPLGAEGYKTIAWEIFRDHGKIDDLFLPVSSATCLVGIFQGFKMLGFLPRIHVCQSTKVFSIAQKFDQEFQPTKTSLATSLVAKLTSRQEEAVKIIQESGGWGWVIADEKTAKTKGKPVKGIKEAANWLSQKGIVTSAEGSLALAGVWKANEYGRQLGKTVCLLTGKMYHSEDNFKN